MSTVHLKIFDHFHKRETTLLLPVCPCRQCSPFKIGSILNGKKIIRANSFFELVPGEMGGKNEIKELLPLEVYPYTLKIKARLFKAC